MLLNNILELFQNGKTVNVVEVCGQFDEKKYVLPHTSCIVTARVSIFPLFYV